MVRHPPPGMVVAWPTERLTARTADGIGLSVVVDGDG